MDLDLSFDSPKELATGFGYTFLNLSHILLCRKSRTEKWHVADFVVKKPYWIQEVAASGQKICVTNDTSLWCSRDLGQHFEYMGNRNDSFGGQSSLHTIGMDSNNLYLVNSHRLWQKNLSGIQPWHPLSGNVSAGYQFTSFSINDELLAIPEDRPGPFIHVSSDGGQNFVHISPMNYPGSPDWPRSIVVNSKYWAFSDWFGIYITKDFGTHWTRIDGAMFGIPVFGNHSDFYYRNKSNSKCRYSLVDQKIYTMDDTHIISGVTDSLLFSINQGKLEYSQLEPINPVEAHSQKFRTHNFSRTKNPTEKIFYKNQFIRNALGKKLPN